MEMLFGFWFCSPLFKACLSKSSLAIAVGFGRFEGVWKNMLFLLFGSMVDYDYSYKSVNFKVRTFRFCMEVDLDYI